MTARPNVFCQLSCLTAGLLLAGCHQTTLTPAVPTTPTSNEAARSANQAFLTQKTFDPWVLTNTDPHTSVNGYIGDGHVGDLVTPDGGSPQIIQAGQYKQGQIIASPNDSKVKHPFTAMASTRIQGGQAYEQRLDLRTGTLSTHPAYDERQFNSYLEPHFDWPRLWQTSDIIIDGDPEAQQVTHANLFYLLSSTFPGSTWSIPPMGLSSSAYGGHIFWDADVWMLPALIVQHPEYAKPIVDYRFKLLAQAKKNARAHEFAGAEYPWESADTGKEEVSGEFAKERHITADVAFAAWQYYLWTGDAAYLKREGWPVLQATAQYWVSRVTKEADGTYHIRGVLSPDETAGVVDDDSYTNAAVQYNLRAATRAAGLVGQRPDLRWAAIAAGLFFPYDKARAIPAENSKPLSDRFAAKQADTLLLLHPLDVAYDQATQRRMLNFYAAHTIKTGPAMTSSIHAVVAAQLGLAQQSLDEFHDSYRPFERAPWDAFSEKRTINNVYFLTGMAGCLQSVLYGFAGLRVYEAGGKATGKKLAGDAVAGLYADPHLPPGWGKLSLKGIRFRGRTLNMTVLPGNAVVVTTPGAEP